MTDKITSTTNEKKRPIILNASGIARQLDLVPDNFDLYNQDTNQLYNVDLTKYNDKKIAKDVYNHFAKNVGLEETSKPYLSKQEVIEKVRPLFETSRDKLIKYSVEFLAYPMDRYNDAWQTEYEKSIKRHDKKSESNKTLWQKFTGYFSSESEDGTFDKINLLKIFGMTFGEATKAKTTMGPYAPSLQTSSPVNAHEMLKLLQDPDKYIKTHSKQEVQTVLRNSADKMSKVLPLSSKLLHLSVTPKDMTLGRHNGYTVLNRNQTVDKLNSMVKEWNPQNVYSDNLYVSPEDINDYKTVVFDKNSPELKDILKDSDIKDTVIKWIRLGKYSDVPVSGVMNDKKDLKLAIHEYYLIGLTYKDNGSSYTVSGYIKDIYDFSENSSGYSKYMGVTRELNHIGAVAQKHGISEPFRIMIPFTMTVSKSEVAAKSKK